MFCGLSISLQCRLRLRSPTALLHQQTAAICTHLISVGSPLVCTVRVRCTVAGQEVSGSTLGSPSLPRWHQYSTQPRPMCCPNPFQLICQRTAGPEPSATHCEPVLAPVHFSLSISLFIPKPAYRYPFRPDLIPVMLYPMTYQPLLFSPKTPVTPPADPPHNRRRHSVQKLKTPHPIPSNWFISTVYLADNLFWLIPFRCADELIMYLYMSV
jgi:hypothetical protein